MTVGRTRSGVLEGMDLVRNAKVRGMEDLRAFSVGMGNSPPRSAAARGKADLMCRWEVVRSGQHQGVEQWCAWRMRKMRFCICKMV